MWICGSGIRVFLTWIRDPGLLDMDPGSGSSWPKSGIRAKKFGSGIRYKRPGSATLVLVAVTSRNMIYAYNLWYRRFWFLLSGFIQAMQISIHKLEKKVLRRVSLFYFQENCCSHFCHFLLSMCTGIVSEFVRSQIRWFRINWMQICSVPFGRLR